MNHAFQRLESWSSRTGGNFEVTKIGNRYFVNLKSGTGRKIKAGMGQGPSLSTAIDDAMELYNRFS